MNEPKSWQIEPSEWTLFLDRDGVINQKLEDTYVYSWSEFVFEEGVLESIPLLMQHFGRIVVVTNQQGIGKEEMTEADLHAIFEELQKAVVEAGGRIDGFYYCPHLASDRTCKCRKPQQGMAHQAKADFPAIDFTKSVMVGDALTDMEFGKRLGMKTVYITNNRYFNETFPDLADIYLESLAEFTSLLVD